MRVVSNDGMGKLVHSLFHTFPALLYSLKQHFGLLVYSYCTFKLMLKPEGVNTNMDWVYAP